MNKDDKNQAETGNQYMTVKTVYARAAMLLLAANFCLTVYCFLSLSSSQQEQIDGLQGTSAIEEPSDLYAGSRTANPVTDQTTTTRDQ